MSYHVLTITSPGSRLSIDRGFMVCRLPDETENRLALSDIRIIIAATPKIAFTGECISRLLEQDSIIMHCSSDFKPLGWSAALDRVIRGEVFHNQIKDDIDHRQALWRAVLQQKVSNQINLLNILKIENNLMPLTQADSIDESNIARWYWDKYFDSLGQNITREKQNAEEFLNQALNYGYAVLQTMIYRAILIHGLCPNIGVHHKYRYRSVPLVYDLMEPYRPFVDLFLHLWYRSNPGLYRSQEDIWKLWIKYCTKNFRSCRLKPHSGSHSYKLMDHIDLSVRSFAACFEDKVYKQSISSLRLPNIQEHYFLDEE